MGERVHCDSRCKVRDESGQVLVFLTVVMVVMIAMAGFALDVGHAYLVQRQLQAATDAAALSAALDLPNTAASLATVTNYGPEPGKKNRLGSNDNARFDVQFKCVTAIVTGCTPTSGLNSLSVRSTSVVSTVFAKVIGIDSFTVHANATACSPCSVKPLDIMIVLDRTGSMCQVSNPNGPGVIQDPMVNAIDPRTGLKYGNPRGCTDLTNAKSGVATFLSRMKPQFHHVGLAVLPPVADASTQTGRCAIPSTQTYNYDNQNAAYTVVGLSSDYLNAGSSFAQTLACLPSVGRTAYADAIDSAQKELATNGRPGVQKVMIFLSDGAANYGGTWHAASSPYRTNPCHQGITSANIAKTALTTVYAIGYDLNGSGTDPEQCSDAVPITSLKAMQDIASAPDTFYNKPDPGQLNTIFSSIADDIFRTAQLIDDSLS
jgi:hypothetical protein